MKALSAIAGLCFVLALTLTVQPVLSAQEKKEILVGTHIPLSGFTAVMGAEQKWAYERSVKDINSKGGIFVKEYGKKLPVRLVVIDDGGNPIKAASAVERLMNVAKVDLLLSGQIGAFGVTPGMITAEKHKVYYHGTVIWIPDFLKHKFKYSTMYSFDIGQGSAMIFDLWNTLPADQRPKRIGLYLEQTPDGVQMGDGWENIAKEYGYNIALREYWVLGTGISTPKFAKAGPQAWTRFRV